MGLSSILAPGSIAKPGVCTSSTRPASPYEGQVIYETDTDNLLVYTGADWYRPWNMPWGIMKYDTATTNNTVIAAEEVAITGSSFTAVANRIYRATYYEPDLSSTVTDDAYMTLRIRKTSLTGTILQTSYEQIDKITKTNRITNVVWVGTLSAGTTNLVATIAYQGTNGYASRASDLVAYLIVEDMGPA